MDIEINSYIVPLGGTLETHAAYEPYLKAAISSHLYSPTLRKVLMYNMNGEQHDHEVGILKKDLVIFNNTTHNTMLNMPTTVETLHVNGTLFNNARVHIATEYYTKIVNIESDQGRIIAQYFPDYYQLNILFDLFSEFNLEYAKVFEFILSKVQIEIDKESATNSWMRTDDKRALESKVKEILESSMHSVINNNRRELERDNNRINEIRREMKQVADRIERLMRALNNDEGVASGLFDKTVKDLNLIAEDSRVVDIIFERELITIFTDDLIITSDTNQRYLGGKFKFTINMSNSDIRFYNPNGHRGYWTDNDPHPHVNGRNGEPCWGNLSSTIAELSSQNELYALTLFCLDYLESVNTLDAAGEKVINWTEIDEYGDIIERDLYTCDECGRQTEEPLLTAYDDYYECHDELNGERQVCQYCLDNYYYYNDNIDEYVQSTIEECDGCYDDRIYEEEEEQRRQMEEANDEEWDDDEEERL